MALYKPAAASSWRISTSIRSPFWNTCHKSMQNISDVHYNFLYKAGPMTIAVQGIKEGPAAKIGGCPFTASSTYCSHLSLHLRRSPGPESSQRAGLVRRCVCVHLVFVLFQGANINCWCAPSKICYIKNEEKPNSGTEIVWSSNQRCTMGWSIFCSILRRTKIDYDFIYTLHCMCK